MQANLNLMNEIQKRQLDAYKDRTGDYRATKLPSYLDFIATTNPKQIPYPRTIAKYGLTRFDYWRLAAKQNYRCAICGDRDKRTLHVDHCHNTNRVRALICHGCNIAIGMIKEDPQTARAIADYLDHHASM